MIIRVLKKNPVVSVINIVGLAIGFTFVILASKFVYTEKTFDHFHANHKAISRVEFEMPEMPVICYSSGLMGQWAKSHIPEVKYATRVVNDQGFGGMQRSILYDNVKFKVENPLIVDDDFFQMFSFPVLAGNLKSFESDRYSVAITQKLSAKIFRARQPVREIDQLQRQSIYSEGPYGRHPGKFVHPVRYVVCPFPISKAMGPKTGGTIACKRLYNPTTTFRYKTFSKKSTTGSSPNSRLWATRKRLLKGAFC